MQNLHIYRNKNFRHEKKLEIFVEKYFSVKFAHFRGLKYFIKLQNDSTAA